MATLLESYKNRLSISESVHQKSHNGARMSANKKLLIASVLNNTSKFINEAFDNSAATQRSALGDYKRFCLNVSTVALPNLILPDLMLTQPMSSITGYITYLRYTAGVTKGGVTDGDLFNGVYRHPKMTEDRVNYTSDKIVEPVEAGTIAFAWEPVAGSVKFCADGATAYTPLTAGEDGKYEAPSKGKVAYTYDNVIIPQEGNNGNAIPTLKAKMSYMQLHAHARRIAVYYSQIAAFQAKTDYGYDIGEQLSTQAQGELAYEIDTEGVFMLNKGAELDRSLRFESYDEHVKKNGNGTYVSRSQYYETFTEIIARAKKIIYQRTQKFAPNYMVVGANNLTILPYLTGWNAASVSTINGPYLAGTVDGLKVFVSPSIDENRFFFGVNGSDLQTSAGVYAPYMAIVPTQLLGFADGTMSQGFSTMYDMKLLSTYKIVDGKRVDIEELNTGAETPDVGDYSWLLVAGEFIPGNEITADTIN